MDCRLAELEQQPHCNTLKFDGISQKDNGTTQNAIIRVAREHLDVEVQTSDIESCFRIGKSNDKLRPILVKFSTYSIQNRCTVT